MPLILVTGAAGYIGSHTLVDLLEAGYEVLAVDSLLRASGKLLAGVEGITGKPIKNHQIDLCDLVSLRHFFEQQAGKIAGVVHFAALKSVPESVEKALWYYQNNLNGLLNLLACVREFGVRDFIFSSSCSVYGNAEKQPVTEDTPLQAAESPYAATKQMSEQILRDAVREAKGALRLVLLRYFNPAGAHESNKIGELPQAGAYNLTPILTETAAGLRKEFQVLGGDYPTRDGSCVRDFIHVCDLARAHTLCLDFLAKLPDDDHQPLCEVFNVGTGRGVTVLEAVKALEQVTGKSLNYRIGERRAGDVIEVYADYSKAARLLNWQPTRSIEDIMRTAWNWQCR